VDGREPQARAPADVLGREERVEDVALRLGVDPRAGVGDRKARVRPRLDARVFVGVALAEPLLAGLDRQDAAVRHRVAAIHREVDDYLLDLAAVGQHRGRVFRGEHGYLDVVADQAGKHRHHGGDHFVQVEDDRLENLLARERE